MAGALFLDRARRRCCALLTRQRGDVRFAVSMFRHPSLLLRLTRAFVGLVTIWCLGCFAYEPIVDSLRGSGAVSAMDCGERRAIEAGRVENGSLGAGKAATSAGATSVDAKSVGATSVGATPSESGFDCGCGGLCHAVSIPYQTLSVPQLIVPLVAHDQPTEPASVTRSPLLPPPQRTA